MYEKNIVTLAKTIAKIAHLWYNLIGNYPNMIRRLLMNKTVNVKSVAGDVYFSYTNNAVMSEKFIAQHCHDGYEILYVVEGSGKYVIEGAEYPIKPGTVLFAPPFFPQTP